MKNKAKINEDPKDALMKQYQKEIEDLRRLLEQEGEADPQQEEEVSSILGSKPDWGGGVYQVCSGRISRCEERKKIAKYNMEKRESKIIFPIILRVLGRISSGKKGKGT